MRSLAYALLLAGTVACAPLRGVVWTRSDVSGSGQVMADHQLREAIALGRYDSALVRATDRKRGAPQDPLLRSLYAGTVAYYAGHWDESAAALGQAAALTEDRYTKSLTKGAASLVTNDRVLPYLPGRTERLLVHYYGMLGRARRGDTVGAAVEARRLGALLEQYREGRAPEEAPSHAALHYVAGVVFEMAGERDDADVAYRNAAALAGDSLYASAADPALPPPSPPPRRRGVRPASLAAAPVADPAPAGEVVVLIEHGWVAHRVEDALVIDLDSGEVRVFAGEHGDRDRSGSGTVRSREPVGAAERILAAMDPDHDSHDWRRSRARVRVGDGGTPLTIAWPRLAPPRREARCAVVIADSLPPVGVRALANLSDATAADFRRNGALLLARTLVRAATKGALAKAAEKKGGAVAKKLVRVGGSMLDHADLRSWQLLPNDVAVARLRLPAGRHTLHAVIEDATGAPRRVELGEVDVRPGALALVTARDW